MRSKNLIFKRAELVDTNNIYEVIYASFKPYRHFYTKQAFDATVISSEKIEDRIINNKYEIYIVLANEKIVGTVSLSIKDHDFLYIRSMAVHPNLQRSGIGCFIMENIENIARENKVKQLVLETSSPLKNAFNFYEKNGFEKTGRTRDFHGVEIYEMIKNI